MRTIAHLSDVHFGREDPRVVEGLVADLAALAPSLVAVSGDLTQRARPQQFRAARAFMDRIPAPSVVVPGNHDVPLFDLASRFLSPLGRYTRFFSEDPEPAFEDEELIVRGVSTARSRTWKEGRISHAQIRFLRSAFCERRAGRVAVLVAHHPFTAPHDRPGARLAGRSARALAALAACGLDLVLTGHLHRRAHGHHDELADHAERLGRSVLAFHAGSATSDRLRGEPNSYNWIVVDGHRVGLVVRTWEGARFEPTARAAFVLAESGWRLAPEATDLTSTSHQGVGR